MPMKRVYTLEDAKTAIQGLETQFEPKRSRFPAVLGKGDAENTVEVPNRGIQWHFARPRGIGGPPQVVFNDLTAPRDGLKVIIERDPAQPQFYRVAEVMIDVPGYLDPDEVPDGGGLKKHHAQHEFYSATGGEDVVFVADRQILGCRVTARDPADLYVTVGWGYVQIGQTGLMTEAGIIDLSSYVPDAGWRWVIITVRDSGSPYGIGEFNVIAGDVHTDARFAYWPRTPINEWRLAAVRLAAGETEITDWPEDVDIIDLRFMGALMGTEWDNTAVVAGSGAQYTSISTACAVASTGDAQVVYVMPGQYLEDVIVPDGISLVGLDAKQCQIFGSVTTECDAGGLQIANLMIYNVGVSDDFMFGLKLCRPDNVQVERVDIYVENDGTGGCAAAWVIGDNSDRVTMFDVYAQSYDTSAYGYYQTGSITDVHLLSCLWNASLYDIYVKDTSEAYLHACSYHVTAHDVDAEIYNVLGVLDDLDNVDEAGVFDGAYLRYEGSTAQWVPSTGGGGSFEGNHNDLPGLQGGAGDQRYHLTAVQHTATAAMVTAGVQNLTAAEVTQLCNIGAATISAAQWGYVGAMDQSVAIADTVQFAGVHVPTGGFVGVNAGVGWTFDNAGGDISTGANVGINEAEPQRLLHITTADYDEGILVESTHASIPLYGGPRLELYVNSVSPAINDYLGSIEFSGMDDLGNKADYAMIGAMIESPTHPLERGKLLFYTANAALSPKVQITYDGILEPFGATGQLGEAAHLWNVNAAYVDVPNTGWIGISAADERVEFYAAGYVSVMGARFGVGTVTPSQALTIYAAQPVVLFQSPTTGTTAADGAWFGVVAASTDFYFVNREASNMLLYTNNTERLRITAGGNIVIGAPAAGAGAAKVLALTNTATAPGASANLVHLYAEDVSASAVLAVYQETAPDVAACTLTHRWLVRINGVSYYIPLDPV